AEPFLSHGLACGLVCSHRPLCLNLPNVLRKIYNDILHWRCSPYENTPIGKRDSDLLKHVPERMQTQVKFALFTVVGFWVLEETVGLKWLIQPASFVVPVPSTFYPIVGAAIMLKGMTAQFLLRRCFKVEHAAAGE
ncbi:hypothetical protein KI387_035495, partial [Taxus chinensis]